MPEISADTARNLDPAQAAELSLLVDLEARWENLRKHPARGQPVGTAPQNLAIIQKSYDAFHTKLVSYNQRYKPAHVPELLLNTPARLAAWCASMCALYLRVEHDARAQCPVHLLAKAYGWAEQIRVRLNKNAVVRSAAPGTIRDAIANLGAVIQWCNELTVAASSA
jgi:hypothetical protein